MRKCLFLLFLVCGMQQSRAETVYIQDLIYVPLRGGASDQHRILHKGLRSGTPLELITEDTDTGYSFVRLENGTEGWIRSQYLQPDIIARDHLTVARQGLAALETENSELRQSIDTMAEDAARMTGENIALSQQHQLIKAELDEMTRLSTDVIRIHEENQHLNGRNKMLLDELDELTQANSQLMRIRDQQWFVAGALTLLVGMLPGFWLARKIYNRRASDWA
jgi:SH3 domain protein